MSVVLLPGSPAFTPARLAKRLKKIQGKNPLVRDIAAAYMHVVDLGEALSLGVPVSTGALRFSLSRLTAPTDVERAAAALAEAVPEIARTVRPARSQES